MFKFTDSGEMSGVEKSGTNGGRVGGITLNRFNTMTMCHVVDREVLSG